MDVSNLQPGQIWHKVILMKCLVPSAFLFQGQLRCQALLRMVAHWVQMINLISPTQHKRQMSPTEVTEKLSDIFLFV